MAYILLCCQLILAVIPLIAATSKLLYAQQFITAIRVSAVPKLLVFPTAIMIIAFEAELALTLIFTTLWMLPFSFGGVFLLLGVFTIWLISVYRRQLHIECGCFGASRSKVSKGNIIRNIVLMGISAFGFFLAFHTPNLLPILPQWLFVTNVTLISFVAAIIFCNRYWFKNTHQGVSTSRFA